MYEAVSGSISLALAGDCLPTRRLAVFREEPYLRLRDLFLAADARFANLESSVHAYLDAPQSQRPGGGTYMTTEPALLNDLTWLGLNMLACGSSHADDYGQAGVMETIRHLDAAGITHAGSGRNLAEARAPAFLETPNGRVALVAATAQFNQGARAGEQRVDTPGHPGVNGLRHREIRELPPFLMDDLRRVGEAIGLSAAGERARNLGEAHSGPDDAYDFLGHTFVPGPEPAVRTRANESDVQEILRQVQAARYLADRVIVSLHCHEQGGPTLLTASRRSEVEDPADFAVDLAHRAIDAGADVFVGHGPQVPLGVEIYKGRPIFHGLGSFIFQLETLRFLPAEAYERYGLGDRSTPADFLRARYADDTRGHTADRRQWEQVCAVCEFDGPDLTQVCLYPLDLGFGQPRSQRGRPVLASGEVAERVLDRVAYLSRRYGTAVQVQDGMGVIKG